ncbi:MAG TPA: helix-turn-helix domain-containing protein [Candidatus Lokiarchaeia archaeon]|nr:helix-turn-helix domain-containing protein [Candidatus Lokiarchaeia archaeon]
MRILKIKISSDFLAVFGYPDYFTLCSYIEMLEIYQYDRTNFFSMQKLVLKIPPGADLEQQIMATFQPQVFQMLERSGNEVLCVMKQRNDSGFWPLLMSENWAIIPPITVDEEAITLTIITREDNLTRFFDAIQSQVRKFEVLVITDAQHALERFGTALPRFTARQREVATYSVRHGFFAHPKKISSQEIAAQFGISVSAVNEHLRKVEAVVMRYFFS